MDGHLKHLGKKKKIGRFSDGENSKEEIASKTTV
jgi:hypothetical protein